MANEINYEILPHHIRAGLQRYIEQGQIPGGFLQAVIANEFVSVVTRADKENRARLDDIAQFMYSEAPGECWGSREKMRAWAARWQ